MGDIPGSVRIRTDDGNEWRYDSIERASDFYGVNRSDSVAYACEDVVQLVDGIEAVLERGDLTLEQRREIAETLSSRGVSFEIETDVNSIRG